MFLVIKLTKSKLKNMLFIYKYSHKIEIPHVEITFINKVRKACALAQSVMTTSPEVKHPPTHPHLRPIFPYVAMVAHHFSR